MDYTAHLSHLETQLVIADAHFAEEKARLVAELEGLYGEIDGLRTGVRNGEPNGRGNGVALSARQSQDKERMGSSRSTKRQESAVGDDSAVHATALNALRTQCDQLEKAHTQDLAQIVELRAAVTNLQQATGLAQRNTEIISQEKQELEEAHRELEVTAQTLQEDIGRLRAQNAELKSDHASLTVDHEILTGEHQDLSDEVVGLRAERRSLRGKVVATEEKVTEAQRERVVVEDRLRERESAVQGLETQLVEQEQGNALLRIRIADLERTATDLKALQEKHDDLREHTDAIEATHISLLTRSTTLERTIESLNERTAAAEKATLSTKFDALAVTLERDSLAEAQQTTQAELTALQDRLRDMEQDKLRDDAVRNELQEELVDIGHENTRLVGENEELMSVRQERDSLGLRVTELEKAVESAQETAASGIKEKEVFEETHKTTQNELEKLRNQISAQKDSLTRATSTETTLIERQADLKALQKTTDALRHENKMLSTTLAKIKAEHEAGKKELVPLRLERDRLRNDGKKVESERNLLRHQVETLRKQGAGPPYPQGNSADPVASLRATHTAEIAARESAHQASQQEIARLHEEREEFKKYCEWVRPDRERLKEELKTLQAAFEASEREKKTLMEEVTRYLQQQQQSPAKPVATPIVPASTAPIPNAQLVEQLRIIDQEFTKYRARVEAELAEGKSELAQVEMEKSMVEEELARVRDAQQTRPKVPRLTSEIHAIIAGFLVGDNAFRSLANLGAISRDFRQATLPILYETLVLDDDGDEDWAYGTRVDVSTGLVLPSGWAFVKHLFLSNKHHDRIKTIIWAAQKPTEAFLDVAFPQLKFHMTYYMHDGSDKPDHPPEWKRVCKLVIHRPVDTTVFHGILTTLSLRCYLVRKPQVTAHGKLNGSADVKSFHNGIKPEVVESAHPACIKPQVPELRLGVINGITEIHFLPRGRLVNRSRSEPRRRYVHQHDTDLSLRLDFTRDDSAVQATLYELSLLFKRPPGMPLKDTKIHLRCPDITTQVYHALVIAICGVLPNAIHNIHITILLSRKETLSFPRFEAIFSVAVRLFSDLWFKIPSRRRDDHARDALPLFHLIGYTHDDVRVDGTIRPRAGSRGTAFVADVQAKDSHGVNVYRSDSYPAMYPKS